MQASNKELRQKLNSVRSNNDTLQRIADQAKADNSAQVRIAQAAKAAAKEAKAQEYYSKMHSAQYLLQLSTACSPLTLTEAARTSASAAATFTLLCLTSASKRKGTRYGVPYSRGWFDLSVISADET